MSLLSEHIEKNPEDAKRLLGIDYKSLQQLKEKAETESKKYRTEKITLIAKGGGRKPSLSNQDQILLTLSYLRHHSTFQYLGLNFGVSESAAHSIFHYWVKILSSLLPPSLLEEFKNADEYKEFLDALSEIELIVDSSEQSRQRPLDKEEREKCYSGYKHNHTAKNLFIVLPKGDEIVDVKIGEYGSKPDINIFREVQIKFNSTQQFKGDKAFFGGENISTPHKKPKKAELTEQQNDENKVFSSKRIFVEHLIRLIKIFRIGEQRFRLRFNHYNRAMSVVCGLVRLRIGALNL